MSKSKSCNKKDVAVKPSYSKVMEAKFDAMLEGDLEKLPPLPRSIVKIFVSSTFSDMREERNALWSEVVPQLKEFCADLDLDFQLVDLRWGLTEDVQNDHSAKKLCLLEIENCQNVSLGPNFISILSHRYGSQALPSHIVVEEFDALRDEATRLESDRVRLLEKWYLLDENCVPHQYVLQPIRRYFKHFGDRSSDNDDKRSKDASDWTKTQTALQGVLCQAAGSLHSANQMSADDKHKYFQSVTESEIEKGVFSVKGAKNHALFYHRTLNGLSSSTLTEEMANKYIAVLNTDGQQHQKYVHEKNAMHQTTTDEKLTGFIENCVCRAREVLGETNYQRLTTDWRPGGINPNRFPEHAGYIQQLVRAVVSQVTALVDKAMSDKKARIRESEYYSDFDEVLHHLRFCNLKCKSFCGQTAVLKQVKDFVLNSSVRHPLIIHANSGAGKTSVMAMIMKNLSSWIKGDFVGVIRFLGTSPGSVNIQNVLFSVCGQLADCGDLIMEPVGYKNMESLVDYLPRFLRQVASTLKQPVIILLDSIDQLSPDNDAYSMWWMPTALPANMKLIISTLPSENDILANIKKKLPATNSGSSSFLEIPPLPQSTGKEITEVFLKMKRRKVTEQQMGLLLTTFAKCANPLYLKLLLDEAVQWGSYSPVEDLVHTLAPSVRAAINVLFDRLEKKFGEVLIKGALGYITVGLNGVSDIELEDALSCDDTVLDDVYAFHDPPIPGIVRIPSVMWARIRHDIGGYLVERLSEGKITLFWYHRQFLEAARDRYADEKNKPSLHKTMYEIYVAESGVKKDIFLSKRKKLIPLADRQVTPQPMYPDNLRKLKCLTHHLIQASSSLDSSIAKGNVFCNLRFLCTKISALSANAVANDMEEYLKITPDEEISVVKTFLQSNKNNLKSSLVLASSLLGYINPNSDQKYLVDLLQSAKAYLQSQNRPILIPAFACLASSGCCHATVRGFSTVVTSNDSKLLLYGEAVDDMDRDSHQKLANGARTTDQTASYDLETHAIGWTSTGLSPFRILLFDLQMKEKWIGDTYKALLELSLQSHAVNAARTYACVLFKDGNLFLLKLNSKKSEGFQCLSHIKKSSDYTATDIHCIGDGSGITVIASCQQSIEQESCGHILIWKTLPDETFDRRSSADDTVLSQYTIKGIFTIFETEPHIPIAKLSLDGKVGKGMSFPCGQNKFVSVCSTGVVTVIDLDRCEIVRSWEAGLIQNACVSATGTQLLVHGNGNLKLFDITDESVLQTMSARLEITAMGVLWEENIALTSHSNGVISLFDLNTGREVSAFSANSFGVTNILAVGKYFVFTSDMHAITILTKEYILDQSKMTSESDERLIYDVCPTKTGLEVITSTYGCLKICALDGTCIRSVPSEGRLDNLYPGVGDLVLCLDAMTKSLTVLNINSGESLMDKTLPSDIIALTLTDDKTNAYAVCGFTLAVYRIDLKALRVSKLFALQKRIIHEGISIKLTASNRYLVLQVRCAEQDYQAVKTLWKKGGRYPTQPHPHKYLAVDLTQGSGSVSSCLRPLTKIPHLGVACAPYRGNVVMLAVKRHVIFWDIPSSKCDQWMSKSKKLVMLYRPDWTGGDKCTGSTVCLAQSRDGTFIAVGSQDGYLFVYNSESGLPVGMKAPSTKHPSMVSHVCVSADSRYVASACHSGLLKLWDPRTAAEVFSLQLTADVGKMQFTAPDSHHLLVTTAAPDSRLMVFSVHSGTVSSS